MVRDEQQATVGDVLHPVHATAEIMPIEPRSDGCDELDDLRVVAERIDAELIEVAAWHALDAFDERGVDTRFQGFLELKKEIGGSHGTFVAASRGRRRGCWGPEGGS
jgi:hypothetical protein